MEFSQDKKCIVCHVSQSDSFKEQVKGKVFDVTVSSIVTEEVCYSCHNVSVKDSREIFTQRHHPVKVVPSRRINIPAEYTLNEKGEIDCGTCHTPHTGKQEGETITSFLRDKNENSFMCLKCHSVLAEGPGRGEHKIFIPMRSDPEIITSRGGRLGGNGLMICETCHVTHGAPRDKLLIYYDDGQDFCTLCHDENPSKAGVGLGMDTHPTEKADLKLEFPKKWDNGRRIRLAKSGNFICQTCHTAHYGYRGQLVTKNTVGELCSTCHQGKANKKDAEIKKNHIIIEKTKDKKGVNCLSCHRTHNAFYDPELEATKLLVKNNENSDLCYACHSDKKTDSIIIAELAGNHPNNMPFTDTKKMRSKLKYLGGKAGRDNKIICNSCHSVHNANTKEANLVMEKDLICLYCHDKENFLIPSSAAKGTHPTNELPKRTEISKVALENGQVSPEGEIICLTCHKVHSAVQESKLLAYKSDEDRFCVSCHKNMERMYEGKHNLLRSDPELKNTLGQIPEESGMCGVCHSAHGYNRDIDIQAGDIINQVCLTCHSEEGPGKNMEQEGRQNHPYDADVKDRFRIYALPMLSKSGKRVVRNGRISCATCHNIHEHERDNLGPKLLRIGSNIISNLCFNCHMDKMTVLGTDHDYSAIDFDDRENINGENIYKGGLCSSCHLVHGGTAKFGFSQEILEEYKGKDPVSILCMTCHGEGGVATESTVKDHGHTVNVDVEKASLLEGKLYLYDAAGNKGKGKKLMCSTCHDPHERSPSAGESVAEIITRGTVSNKFLRMSYDNPDDLCALCHRDEALIAGTVHDSGSKEEDSETVGICRRCHAIHNPRKEFLLWNLKLRVKNKDDNFSQKVCFTCHNRRKFFGTEQKKKYNHPMNIEMNLRYGKEQVITTLPIYNEKWEKDIDNGKVVCFTCHNIHRWNPKSVEKRGGVGVEGETSNSFLRISAQGGYLCTNCHEKMVELFKTEHDLRIFAPFEENIKGLTATESGPCGVCHVVHNATSKSIKLWNRKMGDDSNKLSATCLSCHSTGKIAGKKQTQINYHIPQKESIITYGKKLIFMDVMPFKNNAGIGKNTPFTLYGEKNEVSQEGYLQCISCHNPHEWSVDPYVQGSGEPEEGDITNSFLKLQLPEMASGGFCRECHQGKEADKYMNYHNPPPEKDEYEDTYDDYDSYYDDDYYDDDYYDE